MQDNMTTLYILGNTNRNNRDNLKKNSDNQGTMANPNKWVKVASWYNKRLLRML